MIKCDCGRELSIPSYPHKDNVYNVIFLSDNVVAVTLKCDCGKYLTITYELTKIETITEEGET